MIVDHVLTRSAIRSVGLLCAAIVPLASLHFLYILAYKESALDTVMNELPQLLHILQSNSSLIHDHVHTYSDTLTPRAIIDTAAAPAYVKSCSPTPSSSSTMLSQPSPLDFSEPSQSSTFLIRAAVGLTAFLDSRGYNLAAMMAEPSTLPGYNYIFTLHPFKRLFVDTFLVFVFSHQTLAWIILLVHAWMAAELVSYLHFWRKLSQAQTIDRVTKGPRSREERLELFQRCLETIEPGPGAEHWVKTWFDTGRASAPANFSEIGRSNMMQWLAWSFWAATLEEVMETEQGKADLHRMVEMFEATKHVKFAKGFNSEVQCIRLAFDPVIASHRPLIYYALLYLANILTSIVFYMLGFTRYQGTNVLQPLTVNELEDTIAQEEKKQDTSDCLNPAPATDLSYWYRTPANPKNKVPLVFVHGIGIGLAQYIHFVVALSTISRPIFLIEVPYVSNKFFKTECMSPNETYHALERVLKAHNYTKATFMGHSLGTMLCSAVCKASPATDPKSIVAGLILADPICFLTHHSIARNFAYRIPSTASELVMDLFAAREIGTSWYIMRRFNWDQCIMFPLAWAKQDHQKRLPLQGSFSPVLPPMTHVFLSRKDNLLDMGLIADYLRDQVGLDESKGELVVMEDMDHAGFLLQPRLFLNVLKAAEEC
ncbi:hypothetical protein BGZ94_000636 [Podila epigama]|nr:hypothetical protein BGZ94_000636 [Podila epigama]